MPYAMYIARIPTEFKAGVPLVIHPPFPRGGWEQELVSTSARLRLPLAEARERYLESRATLSGLLFRSCFPPGWYVYQPITQSPHSHLAALVLIWGILCET